ncbi:hypothetical protein ANTRET_LOCUS5403 [Anthophora retusa]
MKKYLTSQRIALIGVETTSNGLSFGSVRNHDYMLKHGRSINSLRRSVAQKGNEVHGMLVNQVVFVRII